MHNIFATFSFPYVAEESGPGIGTGKVGVFSIFVVIFDECLKYLCTYESLYFFVHLFLLFRFGKVDLFAGIEVLVEFLEINWAFFFFLLMFDFSIITILNRNWVCLDNWETGHTGSREGGFTPVYIGP